jgi:hypothetical protein
MKTYNQIVTEFSSCSSDKGPHYLKTLTVEELKLFKNKLYWYTTQPVPIQLSYWWIFNKTIALIDDILIKKLQEDRENKLKELLK